MKKLMIVLFTAVLTMSIAACGTTALQKAQTVAEVSFLAKNYADMKSAVEALPMDEQEAELRDKSIAEFEQIRRDLAALLNGDVDSDRVLDYSTGDTILTRISTAYNRLVQESLYAFHKRTGWAPPANFWQFNRVGVSLYRKLNAQVEGKQGVEAQDMLKLFKLAAVTVVQVKAGKVPGVLLPQGPSI